MSFAVNQRTSVSKLPFSARLYLDRANVVLGIIAILMSMVYPMYTGISERAKATKDMSNLRQIGLATQNYMNDSDGVLPGSITPPTTWMSQLLKYTSVWGIFQSPFDKRPRSEAGNDATPVSYGINFKVYINNAPIPATRISKPTAFILFAPAQNNSATVAFQGTGNTAAPGVNLLGLTNTVTSTPGGVAIGVVRATAANESTRFLPICTAKP